ncbi:hypothetical protein ZEAMMB73_Zm00001d027240 [Zea mays]|uniref:Uncharacterized protein n=1 Tax=Zea mays TaxID=4577 RepID=A0A1D6JJ88_MAIZE|nr:hypothetical protein ZEAMMB73_Zm00001d027240 [Zea mays]ONL92416.1 hypothetical protein ZEAMMB73_Zm00001d027240 [Zea mays]ONL92421.1 hypothetical protein ZEAMMB73_Zm00001d027240 [Zea mays]
MGPFGGIMIECGTNQPIEKVLAAEDAARGCCSIRTTPTSCSCAGSWRSSSRLPNFSTPLSSRAAASWVSSCSTSRLAQLRQQRRHRHCQHQLPMPSRPAIL